MTDSTTRDPAITRDAKAWRDAAGMKYTEALRLIEEPLHQGILGDRIVIRDLLRVLEEDPLLGRNGYAGKFGRTGLHADTAMREELSAELLREVLLSVEALRVFSHSKTLAPGGTPPIDASGIPFDTSLIDMYSREWVSSYEMKHTVESLLAPMGLYISNGAVILAATMIGLPIARFDEPSACEMSDPADWKRTSADQSICGGSIGQPQSPQRFRSTNKGSTRHQTS